MKINYFYETVLEARENYFDDKTELLSLEEVASEISQIFECTDNSEIQEVIEKKADKLINTYMIEMKRKYDLTFTVEHLGYELLCENESQERLKELIMKSWEDLEEFKKILDEIIYLSDKHNVLKLLESIK